MNLKNIESKRQLLAKCVYYTFKLLGVATIDVHIKPSNNRKAQLLLSFASSKFGIAYNLFLACIVLAFYYFTLKVSVIKLSTIRRIHFDNIIFDIHNLSAGLTCIFILTYYCYNQGKTASIANKMKSINDLIVKMNNRTYDHYGKIRRSLKIILYFKGLIWLPIIATIDITDLDVSLGYVYIQACNLTIVCTMLQYSIILNVLRHILGSVNTNFLNITKDAVHSSESNSININHSSSQTKFESVWQLRELYLSVCQVSDDLSQFYSPPMLLCLSHIFITLLFLSHCIIKPIILYGVNTLPIRLIFYCFFRSCQYISSLIILTKMAAAAMSESKNSGRIVSESIGDTKDLYVDLKLYHFSNYLLHRTLQFSVFGLFPLDETLIMSILGSITTYLVICLQFQKSDSE